jgi:hypothetical protein
MTPNHLTQGIEKIPHERRLSIVFPKRVGTPRRRSPPSQRPAIEANKKSPGRKHSRQRGDSSQVPTISRQLPTDGVGADEIDERLTKSLSDRLFTLREILEFRSSSQGQNSSSLPSVWYHPMRVHPIRPAKSPQCDKSNGVGRQESETRAIAEWNEMMDLVEILPMSEGLRS